MIAICKNESVELILLRGHKCFMLDSANVSHLLHRHDGILNISEPCSLGR